MAHLAVFLAGLRCGSAVATGCRCHTSGERPIHGSSDLCAEPSASVASGVQPSHGALINLKRLNHWTDHVLVEALYSPASLIGRHF